MIGTNNTINRAPRTIWVMLGTVFLGLAMIGILLPLLPTTPFLIAAAWAFGKGSPALRQRLIDRPRFGAGLRDWETQRAIAPRNKMLACISMAAVLALSLIAGLSSAIVALQAALITLAMAFILTRPNPMVGSRPAEGVSQ